MATRFTMDELVGYGPTVDARGVAAQHQVTPGAIDTAVEEVFREYNVEPGKADTIRGMLGMDVTSGVARAFYGGMASKGMHEARIRAMRKTLNIPYSLTDEQSSKLMSYAPDFKLHIAGTDSHDHPQYAAQRTIDQMICESRLPPGVRKTDIGANVLHHVKAGHADWHLCNPRVDPKDPVRSTLVNLAVRRLSVDPSAREPVRDAALAYVRGTLSCGLTAQECTAPADAAVCVHVYDIPMSDWAGIMDRRKLRLVEGCMLMSPCLFAESAGRFEIAGLRYEVNAADNIFRMGFEGSPSWWYSHNLQEHLRYGADQVLYGKSAIYSYKVVERRGDTIFFRILRLGGEPKVNAKQYYKLPGVPMVSVTGYDVTMAGRDHKKQEWTWPQSLWDLMVREAMDMLERGSYTTERMFNKYRSAAPRQTINSVVVSGGFEVDLSERVSLVVYSSVEALLQVYRSQAGYRLITDHQMRKRELGMRSGAIQFLRAIGSVVVDGVKMVFKPLERLAESIVRDRDNILAVFSVAPVVQVRSVPAHLVLTTTWAPWHTIQHEHTDDLFIPAVKAVAPEDYLIAAYSSPDVADVLRELYGDSIPAEVRDAMPTRGLIEAAVATTCESEASSRTVVPVGHDCRSVSSAYTSDSVRASILEAITETEIERRNVEASCVKFCAELVVGGEPNVQMLRNKFEEMFQPDFWYVHNGCIGDSVLGRSASDFDFSAVCLPILSAEGSRLHPVRTDVFRGMSKGAHVERENFYIDAVSYTGWAFANTSLTIYNGPEIVKSMRAALDKLHVPRVVVRSGPPGCGKTTIIVKSLARDEVVLCPARASVLETRGRISSMRKDLAFPVLERCRTIDSYLVNYGRSKNVTDLATPLLRGDEAYMTRSGRWLACAILLGAKELHLYGDDQQIPHVPRALVPTVFLKVDADSLLQDWVSYRNPADTVAAYSDLYGWRVRSASKHGRSLWHMGDVASRPVQDGHVMLCMYQDEKAAIRKLYSASGKRFVVMTTHEAQGNTFTHVRLHRFVRGKAQVDGEDRFDLFKRTPYVLVAMSRHTATFEYLSEVGADDVVRRINQGLNPRRAAAAADLVSAGTPKEFL